MTDNLLELNLEISAYIYELHELQKIIKDLAANPGGDIIYFQEISDRYLKLCDKLRIILEAYFREETDAGMPTTFSYKKLYKQLKS